MNLINKIALFLALILTVFALSLSCSVGDDDFRTFLEKHDGKEWLLSKENFDITVYIRLNNCELNLLEQWSYNSELDCHEYNSNIFIPGDFKIKENSMNKLVVECDAIIGPFECMTFSIQDEALRVDIIISEWEEETVYFNKSSVTVDNLGICAIKIKEDLPFRPILLLQSLDNRYISFVSSSGLRFPFKSVSTL